MPISRSNYPKDWRAISRRRREQAGWRCERCGVPDGKMVIRNPAMPMEWIWTEVWLTNFDGFYHCTGRRILGKDMPSDWRKPVLIKLSTCHRNQDSMDCSEGNLAVWCQYCHLNNDRPFNNQKKARRRAVTQAIATGQLALRL